MSLSNSQRVLLKATKLFLVILVCLQLNTRDLLATKLIITTIREYIAVTVITKKCICKRLFLYCGLVQELELHGTSALPKCYVHYMIGKGLQIVKVRNKL